MGYSTNAGKWATWGEITFDPDLGQCVLSNDKLAARWAEKGGFSGTEVHKRQVASCIHLLPWPRQGASVKEPAPSSSAPQEKVLTKARHLMT